MSVRTSYIDGIVSITDGITHIAQCQMCKSVSISYIVGIVSITDGMTHIP